MKTMRKRLFLALALGVSLTGHAYAQASGAATRLRGKIDNLSGDTLNLTLRNGSKASAKLPADLRVT